MIPKLCGTRSICPNLSSYSYICFSAALNSPSNELAISEALQKSALPSAENRHDSKIQLPLIWIEQTNLSRHQRLTMTVENAIPLSQTKILILDDHKLILDGTLKVLNQHYPTAEILTLATAQNLLATVKTFQPDLIVMDLSIPGKTGMTAHTEIGIELLQSLMKQEPNLNIMVQSSYIKALVRLKHDIDNHQGGFTLADKSISEQEMALRINWALQGITHTKDLKVDLAVKPEWLEVLELAADGLQDRAIAKQMNAHERTVRNYWTKIQDALDIYPEEDKNLRVLTLKKAREEGLLD